MGRDTDPGLSLQRLSPRCQNLATPTPNTQVYNRAQAILFQLNGACKVYFIGMNNVATLVFAFLSITFGGLIPDTHSDQFSSRRGSPQISA